ncbi:MAG: hypothetical protein QOF67_3290 [Mycobacterium sp.]|nr:hypothetical protein [Mycobacterium sp.]
MSLHAITRHPPPPTGRVLVYGAGSLGLCAVTVLRVLYLQVAVAVVARFDAQAELAHRFGADKVLAHEPRPAVIEELVAWFEVGVRVLASRGTLVKAGVHAPGRWEWSPLYFKEINWVGSNAFGVEEVSGERKHAIAHYLDLAADGRVDLSPMLTHTFGLEQWRDGFLAIANQGESGAVKVAIDYR